MHIRYGVLKDIALASRTLEASWPRTGSWVSSSWSRPRTASPWPCPWMLSLILPWTFKFSGNQPSTGLHSHKCQEVLRFHSWAVLFSWLCGFMEGGRARSRFPFTPSHARKICCSTATSVLVERVFSHSRLFMHPHRSRMGDRMLSDLVLLTCNKHV